MGERRQELLQSKLGVLLTWTKPDIAETVGPYDPSVFDEFDELRSAVVKECREVLEEFSEVEIAVLADRSSEDPTGVQDRWRELREEEVRRLRRLPPPWYAGGFGHSDKVADFAYWSRMANFAIHELLCLSVGVEPASFEEDWLIKCGDDDVDRLWKPLRFLLRRREQLVRQFSLGTPRPRVSPLSFLSWVDKVTFETHPEFLRLVRKHHAGAGTREGLWSSGPAQEDKREVDKIAQLFAAMAIDQLGYDPKQARSPIPKEIADLAASMGLSVSDDTVRKYLRLGASRIPDDWKRE